MNVLTLKHTAEYKAYFRALSTRANFIDHFYYGFDEAKSKAQKEKGTKLVLEPYDNIITENQDDNVLANRGGMFVILKPYTSVLGNSLSDIQDECELLCYKVIGQMKRDSQKHILRAPITNYRGMEIAPSIPGYAGYAIEFEFHAPVNSLMAYDADDWTEE